MTDLQFSTLMDTVNALGVVLAFAMGYLAGWQQ
jgi:hypothetical protein